MKLVAGQIGGRRKGTHEGGAYGVWGHSGRGLASRRGEKITQWMCNFTAVVPLNKREVQREKNYTADVQFSAFHARVGRTWRGGAGGGRTRSLASQSGQMSNSLCSGLKLGQK